MPLPQSSSLRPSDRIEIINLAHGADRRREVVREVFKIGYTLGGQPIKYLPAERRHDAGGFDTNGTRGCFLSHLTAPTKARKIGRQSPLISEDDVAFSASELERIDTATIVPRLQPCDELWAASPVNHADNHVTKLEPKTHAVGHFVALPRTAIEKAVLYLKAMLKRPPTALKMALWTLIGHTDVCVALILGR